jgi:hypothetical protein
MHRIQQTNPTCTDTKIRLLEIGREHVRREIPGGGDDPSRHHPEQSQEPQHPETDPLPHPPRLEQRVQGQGADDEELHVVGQVPGPPHALYRGRESIGCDERGEKDKGTTGALQTLTYSLVSTPSVLL